MFISRRLYPIPLLFVLFGLFILAGQAAGSTQPAATPAELVGTILEQGGCLWETVGPGPIQGSQRFYMSFGYPESFEIASVDVDTGQILTYTNSTTGETMVWSMTVGPDDAIYLGTYPHGHLMRLDPKNPLIQDLGQPAPGETHIWSLTTGVDGKIYGGTSPHARLIRYDPASGKSEDLGSMSAKETFVRSVAASQDGFIYAGIGYGTAHLVAYEIASGTYRDILPVELQRQGEGMMVGRFGGKVYAEWASQWRPKDQWRGRKGQKFLLEGWSITPASGQNVPLYDERYFLADGRAVMLDQAAQVYYDNYLPLIPGNPFAPVGDPVRKAPAEMSGRLRLMVVDPQSGNTRYTTFNYQGRAMDTWRLFGASDGIYGSTYVPAYFFHLAPESGEIETIGYVGGEVYSMLEIGDRLFLAGYTLPAPIMAYDPSVEFNMGWSPLRNPRLFAWPGWMSTWRPISFLSAPNGKAYIGAIAGYGLLESPLFEVDPVSLQVRQYPIATDQSIASLTNIGNLIIGGTSILGGSGSHPTQKTGELFLWDANTHQKIYSTLPVSGTTNVSNLLAAPNGMVYGIAEDGVAQRLFVFDPQERKVISTTTLPKGVSQLYNSLILGPDGRIWGLHYTGLFAIDLVSNTISKVVQVNFRVRGGIATYGDYIYFTSRTAIWRYKVVRGIIPDQPLESPAIRQD